MKTRGVLTLPDGGFQTGAISLPVDEAVAAIAERRFMFAETPDTAPSDDVEMLLAGLEVGSIGELHRLVSLGRSAEEAAMQVRIARPPDDPDSLAGRRVRVVDEGSIYHGKTGVVVEERAASCVVLLDGSTLPAAPFSLEGGPGYNRIELVE